MSDLIPLPKIQLVSAYPGVNAFFSPESFRIDKSGIFWTGVISYELADGTPIHIPGGDITPRNVALRSPEIEAFITNFLTPLEGWWLQFVSTPEEAAILNINIQPPEQS